MSTRRTFLKQAGLITSAAWINPPSFFNTKYKLGLQLYTIRDAIEKDVRAAMKQIAGYGYEEVETYGFNKHYWGFDPKTAKQILDDNDLTTSSGHYDLDKYLLNNATEDDMKRYVDDCIEGAHALKQDYIVWPWLDPSLRSIEKFKLVAATLNKIGEQIKKGGLQLAYHNHNFEFTEQNGQIGYDIILNETDASLVKLQIDLYWIAYASKLKPHEWFLKQPGRFVSWHLKDMDKVNRDYEVMGEGSIDFKTIMPDAKLSGVKHIFVEQGGNFKPDALSCVARSAAYVKNTLFK
ncbi:sugar phosphate isomerase/epimerase [Chitinophaga sp. OAE865]|uniref:sugar phosphate isomerase/epimerase family protein n=1 Tax=Chitinophaga sp. OAE865 TaxID=2817898 RepID=UPI001AEA2AB5